jgi:hypothetical protein
MAQCGTSGLTRVNNCSRPGTRGWQRWANDEEVGQLHESGDLPAHETEAAMAVYACDPHAAESRMAEQVPAAEEGGDPTYVGTDLATVIHDANCLAPAQGGECSRCATYAEQHPAQPDEG